MTLARSLVFFLTAILLLYFVSLGKSEIKLLSRSKRNSRGLDKNQRSAARINVSPEKARSLPSIKCVKQLLGKCNRLAPRCHGSILHKRSVPNEKSRKRIKNLRRSRRRRRNRRRSSKRNRSRKVTKRIRVTCFLCRRVCW